MQRDHEAWESAQTARTVVRPQEIVTVRLMNVIEESKLLNTLGKCIRDLLSLNDHQPRSQEVILLIYLKRRKANYPLIRDRREESFL